MKRTAYINIGELATLAGPPQPRLRTDLSDLGLVRDAGILVECVEGIDRIVATGKSGEIASLLGSDGDAVDLEGRLVVPAFVDSHTHVCFAGTRADEWERRAGGATYQEIAARGGGILNTVRATREASEADLVDATRRHLNWMTGTGAVEVKSGYGLSAIEELKMLRAAKLALGDRPHRLTFLGAHAVPPEASDRAAYLHHLTTEAMVEAARFADYADMFVESGYFAPDDCRRYAHAAQGLGMKVRLHVDQLEDGGGASLAAEVGAVSADHLEFTSEKGMRDLASAGVFAGLLPASVFGLRSHHYPDARKMVDLGVAVCLATDFNPGSSPFASMPLCMRLAVDYMGLTAAEALAAATINPAYSLDLEDEVGSLEPGKRALFQVYEADSYREIAYWLGASAQPIMRPRAG